MTEAATAVDTAAVPTKKNDPVDGGVNAELVGRLVEQARAAAGLQLTGEGCCCSSSPSGWSRPPLDGEITDHLGYDKGDPPGNTGGNSRRTLRCPATRLLRIHLPGPPLIEQPILWPTAGRCAFRHAAITRMN
jgi:hypothetical protein